MVQELLGKVSRSSGNWMRTIQPKILEIPRAKWMERNLPGKKFSKIWVYLARLSSVYEIFENTVPFIFAENSDWKSGLNGKLPLSFFPLSLERPKFSVPFVWITCSAGSLLGEREILSVFCKLYKSIQFLFSVRKAMVVYCLELSIRRNSTTFSDVLFLPEIFQKECYIYFPMGLSGN